MSKYTTSTKSQAGFTLVELAIVMIIIGLLIGGILKGQELIGNAKVTSTVAQIKSIDAASNTFRDAYNAMPGDFSQAATRLPNCNANPCNNGNGNGTLGTVAGAALAVGDEGTFFFNHLRAADLLGGFDGTATASFGQALPTANIGGGYLVGAASATGGATGLAGSTLIANQPYLVLTGQNEAAAATTGVASPTQAARIDRKMDDGQIAQGSVQSAGTNCADGNVYNEDTTGAVCNVYARVGG